MYDALEMALKAKFIHPDANFSNACALMQHSQRTGELVSKYAAVFKSFVYAAYLEENSAHFGPILHDVFIHGFLLKYDQMMGGVAIPTLEEAINKATHLETAKMVTENLKSASKTALAAQVNSVNPFSDTVLSNTVFESNSEAKIALSNMENCIALALSKSSESLNSKNTVAHINKMFN